MYRIKFIPSFNLRVGFFNISPLLSKLILIESGILNDIDEVDKIYRNLPVHSDEDKFEK